MQAVSGAAKEMRTNLLLFPQEVVWIQSIFPQELSVKFAKGTTRVGHIPPRERHNHIKDRVPVSILSRKCFDLRLHPWLPLR